MLQKPQIDGHDVIYQHEIARLGACGEARVRAEEVNLAAGPELIEMMEGDRSHASLVLLARPIHVEVAESDYLRAHRRQRSAHDVVKQQLRVAIHVQRLLMLRLFLKD